MAGRTDAKEMEEDPASRPTALAGGGRLRSSHGQLCSIPKARVADHPAFWIMKPKKKS